jgi:hypothetical protein
MDFEEVILCKEMVVSFLFRIQNNVIDDMKGVKIYQAWKHDDGRRSLQGNTCLLNLSFLAKLYF